MHARLLCALVAMLLTVLDGQHLLFAGNVVANVISQTYVFTEDPLAMPVYVSLQGLLMQQSFQNILQSLGSAPSEVDTFTCFGNTPPCASL